MIANDIEFNNIKGSDYGVMLCSFDGGTDFETVSAGAEINLNQVASIHGDFWDSTEITYDSPLEATFQICKVNCRGDNPYFSLEECREITRWLTGPTTPKKLKLLSSETDAYDQIVFEGNFSVYNIKFGDKIIGFELKFVSNRPFALGIPKKHVINATSANYVYSFEDPSDNPGHIYPETMKITFTQNCTELKITNSAENRMTILYNCKANEVITITNKLFISSSDPNHKIQNDFNYRFFRIANSLDNRLNKITISNPCKIEFVYHPIVRGVGL